MNSIPNITFQGKENAADVEFLNISELYSRMKDTPDHDPKQPHRIDFFALMIITVGDGYHQIDLKKYNIGKGTVLKIAKGQVHAFQENPNYDGYLILFTEEFVLKYFSESSIDIISHLYNYHISDPLVKNSTFNDLFGTLFQEELSCENTYAQKNIIAKMLELYLLKLERISNSTITEKQNKKYYMLFIQFKNLVEAKFTKTRNVKDYAEELSVSTKHLNKVIYDFTLNTAKNFIDQYVILEIKRAILSTNCSLKEIAFDKGFDEVTNFTKFFKKHSGVTPKEFKSSL